MKTVFLLFDSLNKRMLAPYNNEVDYTPNFKRLAKKSIIFYNTHTLVLIRNTKFR